MNKRNLKGIDEILIYDVEVFKFNTIIVFKQYNKPGYCVFEDDFRDLKDLIKNKVLVGFNNYRYDDYILSAILEGKTQEYIKQLNDYIISGGDMRDLEVGNTFYKLNTLDTMQELNNRISLKEFQANKGLSIEESPIDFNLNRPLNDREKELVKSYCIHDVYSTEILFEERIDSYFRPKLELVKMTNKSCNKWNTTTIAAEILTNGHKLFNWEYLRVDKKYLELVPEEVLDYWINNAKYVVNNNKVESFKYLEDGYELVFGFGGLHFGNKTIAQNVVLLDVSSMYPNIIINNDFLGFETLAYRKILAERMIAKNENDLNRSNALKLILNSVYGNFKNKYSNLYNPHAGVSTCITGQIAIYDLFRRLKKYGEIININTDGIAFVPKNNLWKKASMDWTLYWHLELIEKHYSKWIQKDVNNYIAQEVNGKIVTKGTDVNNFEYNPLGKVKHNIVDLCLVNYFLQDITIAETIKNNLNDPKLFQIILKTSNKFAATVDENKVIRNKVNRVFASKIGTHCLKRLRNDGNFSKFPDAPNKMLVFNDSLDNLDINKFKEILDTEYYLELANKKLKNWPVKNVIKLKDNTSKLREIERMII
ncbi:hypothetical protein KQI68_01475 [Peptoniphilus sp. MSJ-1]|uniref:DNA-directed DNA polymerase n=1 Tax=Peptoniphilus ovalis TaxID=2841503 RepID=A0ABS6FE98_9FIRM|nr:hypothetical protein [Peptoniphilus ovalis]MBU5668502.1 hypothetical protein [Peptoniphilus ovalis]